MLDIFEESKNDKAHLGEVGLFVSGQSRIVSSWPGSPSVSQLDP